MHYGEKISEIRTNLNMSIRQFANLVGYSYSYISKLEKGKSNPQGKDLKPSIDVLKNICEKSNYPFQKFLYETNYLPEYKINDENDTNNKFNMAIGERLKELRKNAKISQEKLGKLVNVSQQAVAKWENNVAEPDQKTLLKIAEFFNVSTDYLLGREHKQSLAEIENNKLQKILNDIGAEPLKDLYPIPLLGDVVAGIPIESPELFEGYVYISYTPPNEYFALLVHGDSMINAGITDKSILIVHQQNYADNGDIVVALVDGEATVKRFRNENNTIFLMPENNNYLPIVITENNTLCIVGKVVEIRTKI